MNKFSRGIRRYLWLGMFICSPVGIGLEAEPVESSSATRVEAAGDLTGLPEMQRLAFEPDQAFFMPLPKPRPMDWLASHEEPGQTVAEYLQQLPLSKPKAHQRTLCLLPLGNFSGGAPPLETLKAYCEAFFGMTTQVLKPIDLAQVPAHGRLNPHTKNYQLLTTDILNWLPSRKPTDCYAMIAVTMTDLYPDEKWNFVFGQAMLRGGAGVFSFARYDPTFYGDAEGARASELILSRSCKVLSHEMGHMFGLRHCIHYQCIMNGSNHLGESDSKPMHVCPVCLRKLHLVTGLDLLERERSLLKFYQTHLMEEEADWTVRRIDKMTSVE